MLKNFTLISCVDEKVKQSLAQMHLPSFVTITADGDTRYDQVFARLEQTPQIQLITKERVFTFGSTWPEDEAKLASLFHEVILNGHRFVLSPHDVSSANISRIEKFLTERNYDYKKVSQLSNQIDFNFSVLLIDRIGYLADAYRDSDFAFVGGSFRARVHSVMEPLACGLPVLIGPHYQNNPEAIHYAAKENEDYVFVCNSEEELLKNYRRVNAFDLTSHKLKIKSQIQKNQGASKKITDFILSTVLKNSDS